MRRSMVALALIVVVVGVPPIGVPQAAAIDGIGGGSGLNPWSIDGALFARGDGGVRNVDIPGTCLSAYEDWEELHLREHAAAVAALVGRYWERRAENDALVDAGEEPIHADVPPVTPIGASAYVARWLPMPFDPQDWLEQEWEPMEFAPGTKIPCYGIGLLPSPPGGFIGINLGDEPPDPDPCEVRGMLPFSPALWTWYPSWHERAPVGDSGPYSGIRSHYDGTDGEFFFSFVPIIIGVQLVVECLPIFPNEEASVHFEELLPAAELAVVPEAIGLTGAKTRLWYDFAGRPVVGPITVGFEHRGTDWTLTAYAWVDAVGWDLDFDGSDGGDPVWDESVDFPDTAWRPATDAEYDALGGSREEPARVYVYEAKAFYDIATGVTWRGYYVVEEIGGLGWGFTEQYDPVTRWTIVPYQVDEIVGRRN